MKPIRISRLDESGFESGTEVIYAEDQPEYIQLPAIRFPGTEGLVVTRWTFTNEERDAIDAGADLFLGTMTFNQPLQPLILSVGPEGIF